MAADRPTQLHRRLPLRPTSAFRTSQARPIRSAVDLVRPRVLRDGSQRTGGVQFSAMFPYAQSLMTDIYGVQATSEVILNLTIDGQTVLFFDSPLTIGPSTSLATSGSPTLTNSMTLTAGQTYDLYLEIDSESSGMNATPEPATLTLLLGGASYLLFAPSAVFAFLDRRGLGPGPSDSGYSNSKEGIAPCHAFERLSCSVIVLQPDHSGLISADCPGEIQRRR